MNEPDSLNPHPLRTWRLRQKPALTQDEFAARVGTSKATISRIEARLQDPTVALIRRIVATTKGAVSAEGLVIQVPAVRRRHDAASTDNSSISEA